MQICSLDSYQKRMKLSVDVFDTDDYELNEILMKTLTQVDVREMARHGQKGLKLRLKDPKRPLA